MKTLTKSPESPKEILTELNDIHREQAALAERATQLMKKLGEVSTSPGSRKGRVVPMDQRTKVLGKRRQSAFK